MYAVIIFAVFSLAALPWVVAEGRADNKTATKTATKDGTGNFPINSPVKSGRAAPWPGDIAALGRVDIAVLLDLASAGCSAGSSIPAVLKALASATAEEDLLRVSRLLLWGASWEEAWFDTEPRWTSLAVALEPAWTDGASPLPLLRQAGVRLRAERERQAHEAAAKLGVQLVLPLGLCLLPAFILWGVIPLVLSLAEGILPG